MQNIDQAKVESIATSYSEYLESGYTAAQAETLVRKLAPDNFCDTSMIERGIELGKSWASKTGRILFLDKVTGRGQWKIVRRNEGGVEVYISQDLADTPDGWVTLRTDMLADVVWE